MSEEPAIRPEGRIGVRHTQIFIMFLGLVVAYLQRVDMSVALAAMTDTQGNVDTSPGINYTTKEKGILLGTFFWGYMVSNIPGGFLADRFGPSNFISVIGVVCGLLSIATPIVMNHINFYTTCVFRGLQGLCQGFICPCINAHLAKWAIPKERGVFSYVWSGAQLGTLLMMFVGGYLASSQGWAMVFYASGGLSAAWGGFSMLFTWNSPSLHPVISKDEKRYIESNYKTASLERKPIPWCSILSSRPFIVLMFTQFCAYWGYFTFLTWIPTFLKSVFKLSTEKVALYSSLPYVFSFVAGIAIALSGDYITKVRSTNFCRKLWNSIGLYGAAVPIALLSIVQIHAVGAAILLSVALFLFAGVHCGYMVNYLDLAPNFAGVLFGISTTFAMIGCIAGPISTGFIVKDETNIMEWQIVWLIVAGVYVLGGTVFLFFGKTETQTWNGSNTSNNGQTRNVIELSEF